MPAACRHYKKVVHKATGLFNPQPTTSYHCDSPKNRGKSCYGPNGNNDKAAKECQHHNSYFPKSKNF
jgi:hypothetical protein